MAYHTTDPFGITEVNPDVSKMREILQNLEDADAAEHPDASLMHDSGWTLTVFPGGVVTWENLDDEEDLDQGPLLMRGLEADRVLDLWVRLSRGHIKAIASEPWMRGE